MDASQPLIRPIQLPFYVLQYRVGTMTFLASDRTADWLAGDPKAEHELRPPPDLAADCDVAIVRSQPLVDEVATLVFQSPWIRYVRSRYRRRYIQMHGSFREYLAGFSSKSRSTLIRKVKRFTQTSGGTLEIQSYASPERMDDFFGQAREVSRKTYQERLFDAGLPDTEEFRRSLISRAADDGVRGFVLCLTGQPVAYLLCPVERDRLLYGFLGYDPAVAHLSPGTVLQYAALEHLFGEGRFSIFDFTEGDGAHKEFFATAYRDCGDVYFFRRSARNSIAVSAHRGLERVSFEARRLLDRVGVGSRLKRLTRRSRSPVPSGRAG